MKIKLFKKSGKNALEKRFTTFTEQLSSIFDRIKTDINQTNSRVGNFEDDLKRLNQWISYLNSQNSSLSDQNEFLKRKYEYINRKNDSLYDSHKRLTSQAEGVSRVVEDHRETLRSHKLEVSALLDSHKEDLKKALERQQNLSKDEVERLKSWVSYYMNLADKQKEREDALGAELSALRGSLTEKTQSSENTINALRSDNIALKQHVQAVSEQLENLNSSLISTKNELSETKEELENTQKNIENLRNLSESETSAQKSPHIQPVQQQAIQAPEPQMSQFQPQNASTAFERHIISRVMPNRKGYIMRFIMELVSEQRYSTKEIEEMIVKEKNLCGRTSFYGYLKELKLKGRLGYANIDERSILVNVESNTQQQLDNYQK